jgi:RNA polymerase sigma-70 factor (ECF subfamily)
MTGQGTASGSNYPQQDPDADLLEPLARGSDTERANALNALMGRHLKSVKSLAWHMMGDEMIAEDVAQETFLKAWTHAEKWEPGRAKFSTWLHRVAKNNCYDRLRKKREIYSDTLPEMVDGAASATEMMISDEIDTVQKETVQQALSRLPERQLAAITLCHFENKSQSEAAEILEIGVRAYESLLARARRNLRGELAGQETQLLGHLGPS